ncbi:MAG: NfeD family protein [Sulfuricurvum sp.]|nr:NfeD family protein [Sulfuricurvum sp.]
MSYYLWLIFAVVAFVVEMMLPTFFALFAGIGFLAAAAVTYFFTTSLAVQLLTASLFMIIGAVVFKKRHIGDDERDAVGTHNEFVGIKGVVKTPLTTNHEGEVELYEPIVGSRHWAAVSLEGDIGIDAEIRVVKLNGNTVIVEKV